MVTRNHTKHINNNWKNYEEVARYLLNQVASEFGLELVEGKQLIEGQHTGTTWEIDAKGIKRNDEGIILVECRRYTTSRQNQKALGALAYTISDTKAVGGIIVSPLGLQTGAELVAKSENIVSVLLTENSTTHEYLMRFLGKIMVGLSHPVHVSMAPVSLDYRRVIFGKDFEQTD
jgi:hypothetical protein